VSLVALAPRSGRGTPVFLVHGVGGTALGYRELALRLPRPCFGIEARGIDGQEAPLDCVEALAAAYIDEIRAQSAPGSWLLGGWSFGGIVAFEMSVQLSRAGVPVCAALLDSRGLAERTAGEAPPMEGAEFRGLRATHAAHVAALARYRPGRTTAPLLVVRATEAPGAADPSLGFDALAGDRLETIAVRAAHEGLLVPPQVDIVTSALDGFFARWDRG
jgi:pimeloyl-ACP methyl ester carboxylesterase